MQFGRRALPLLSCAVAGLSGPGHAAPPGGVLGRILAAGRIGVWVEGVPYGIGEPDGSLSGLEIEAARDLARSLGVEADRVPLAFSQRFAVVASRGADVACALMLITPPRLQQVAFAAPHGEFITILATTRQHRLTSLGDLSGGRTLALSDDMLREGPGLPPFAGIHLVPNVERAMATPLSEPDLRRFPNTWLFLRDEDGTFASGCETFPSGPSPMVARL